MDLGEVVEINQSGFALTTPSPQVDNILRLNCGRIHPSLNKEGKHSFSIFNIRFISYSLWNCIPQCFCTFFFQLRVTKLSIRVTAKIKKLFSL